MKTKINKLLIANRGEIAVRIIKTCKEMNIKTVAIYSDVDRESLHVKEANEAYFIGSAPARESYLNQEKIVAIAKKTQCDAIHPGYGFLSENSEFVKLVTQSNLIFVGPDANAIRLMGDKTAARRLAQSISIPIVPGTTEPLESFDQAIEIAHQMAFPILLKAAGGGGGKGMRIVLSESDLSSAFRASQSEARSAFGDDRIYIEKYILNPRHIEVQILADKHGHVVHLGERECSIQRRHQKIVEESPSIFIDQRIREELTQSALKLIQASGYTNAGTLEFIFDENRKFYFLEMNTRLQVEHTVTEMRIRKDIVREQIQIAAGEELSFTQKDVKFDGHAVECRIYAEDPANSFFPSTGKIVSLKAPTGLGVRDDRGIEEGNIISPYYDPIISKLITWGNDRSEALSRMSSALSAYEIFGVRNNLKLCSWIINHPKFVEGAYNTNFLQDNFDENCFNNISDDVLKIGSIIAILQNTTSDQSEDLILNEQPRSKWKAKILEDFR